MAAGVEPWSVRAVTSISAAGVATFQIDYTIFLKTRANPRHRRASGERPAARTAKSMRVAAVSQFAGLHRAGLERALDQMGLFDFVDAVVQ